MGTGISGGKESMKGSFRASQHDLCPEGPRYVGTTEKTASLGLGGTCWVPVRRQHP